MNFTHNYKNTVSTFGNYFPLQVSTFVGEIFWNSVESKSNGKVMSNWRYKFRHFLVKISEIL